MWNPALAGADPTSAWVFFQNLAVAPPGCGGHFFLTALIRKRGCRQKGSEMRVFVASLIVLLVLYFWDRDYNNGNLVDGLDSMRRAISHSMSH